MKLSTWRKSVFMLRKCIKAFLMVLIQMFKHGLGPSADVSWVMSQGQ